MVLVPSSTIQTDLLRQTLHPQNSKAGVLAAFDRQDDHDLQKRISTRISHDDISKWESLEEPFLGSWRENRRKLVIRLAFHHVVSTKTKTRGTIVGGKKRRLMFMKTLSSFVAVTLVFSQSAGAFLYPNTVSSRTDSRLVRYLSDGDNRGDQATQLRPETSFGAEAVPEGQRPVNEYLDLTRAPLFDWASEETGTKGFLFRVGALYAVIFWAVAFPISGATFTQEGYLLQKLAASNVGSLFITLLLLVRLYSGWGYVGTRLKSKVIEFEETGWYDGDIEFKTEQEKQRDMFLYNDQVRPVETRLQLVTGATLVFFFISVFGLNAAMEAKPVFDQYDPKMLERLQYDDKLSDVAASQTGGRPAYCDSRYYRAVANGGQGCD